MNEFPSQFKFDGDIMYKIIIPEKIYSKSKLPSNLNYARKIVSETALATEYMLTSPTPRAHYVVITSL